jgi:hypothetical protein
MKQLEKKILLSGFKSSNRRQTGFVTLGASMHQLALDMS